MLAREGPNQGLERPTAAAAIGIPFVDSLAPYAPWSEFVERIPIGFARQHALMGLAEPGGGVAVALRGLDEWPQLDVVSRYLGRPVEPILAPAHAIQSAINAAYGQRRGQAQAVIESLGERADLGEFDVGSREDLLDVAGRAPVIKLVNLILFEAVKGEASDVHVQPYEDRLVARLRIDGVLFDAFNVPKDRQDEVVSRIKVIGGMNKIGRAHV